MPCKTTSSLLNMFKFGRLPPRVEIKPSKAWRLSLDTNILERLPKKFYSTKLVFFLLGGN